MGDIHSKGKDCPGEGKGATEGLNSMFTLGIEITSNLNRKTFSALKTLEDKLTSATKEGLKLSSALKEIEVWKIPKVEPLKLVDNYEGFVSYTKTVHKLTKELKQLQKEGKQNTEEFKKLRATLKRLGIDTENLEGEISSLAYALEKLRQRAHIKVKLESNIAKFKEELSNWHATVATAMTLAVPIKVGADFEAQIVRVKALAGATAEQFERLKAKALELGSSTKYSASQVAEAMEYMVMAGMKVNQILVSAKDVLNLATVGNLDLARASDIATNIMSGFGLKASELSHVVDVMAKVITTSNTTVESLGETMKYVAPVASQLGVSLEEVSAMAGLLGNVGIQGSMAGTTLRAMMLRLSAPTGEAAQALAALGIQTTDAMGRLKPLPVLLKEIAKALKALPQAQQMEYLKAIFGEEPAAGVAALLKAADTGELDKYLKEVKNAKGAAAKMVEEMNSTLTAKWQGLLSALETLMIEVFEPMKPYLKAFIEGLTVAVRTLTVILKPIMPILAPILLGLGSFLIVSKLVTLGILAFRIATLSLNSTLLLSAARLALFRGALLSLNFSGIIGGIRGFIASLFTLGNASTFAVGRMALLRGASSLLMGGFRLLMGLNPFGLVILGATTLLPMLWKLIGGWEGIKHALGKVKEFAGKVWEGIKAGAKAVWEGVKTVGGWLKDKLVAGFKTAVKGAKEFVNAYINAWKTIGQYTLKAVSWIWDKVKSFAKGLADTLKGVVHRTLSFAKAVKDKAAGVAKSVKEKITGGWNAIKSFFGFGTKKETHKEVVKTTAQTHREYRELITHEGGKTFKVQIGSITVNISAADIKEGLGELKDRIRQIVEEAIEEALERKERELKLQMGY